MAAQLADWKREDLDIVEDRIALRQKIEATIRHCRMVVFATWRERQDVSEILDELCFAAAIPWTSIVAEHPWVRVGPRIIPPRTPCYRCFTLRRLQHDRHPQLSLALQAAYAADWRLGVRGYLPHHILIAAGLLGSALEQLQNDDEPRSQVALYHTLRHEIMLDHVVGVHGCTRCDLASHTRSNEPILACIKPQAEQCDQPTTAESVEELP
jgi:hypothetical protein